MLPPIPTYPNSHILDEDELEVLEKIEEKWDLHNQHKASVNAQILTTIPEAMAIEIQNMATGKEMWDALCMKHEKRAFTVIVDLQCRMYVLDCRGSDVVGLYAVD